MQEVPTFDPGMPGSPLRPGSPVAPLGPTIPGPPRSPGAPCNTKKDMMGEWKDRELAMHD